MGFKQVTSFIGKFMSLFSSKKIVFPAASVLMCAFAGSALAQDTNIILPLDLPALTEFVPSGSTNAIGSSSANLRSVELDARLVEGAQPLEHGLVWRVYHPVANQDGKLPVLATSEGGKANFEFEPGEYFVHVAFGLAGVTRKLSVPEDAPVDSVNFILNAGGSFSMVFPVMMCPLLR